MTNCMITLKNPAENSSLKVKSAARVRLFSASASKIYSNEVPGKWSKKPVTKDLILRYKYSNTTLQSQRIQWWTKQDSNVWQ